jgi:uncharacterized protein YllA (UPF0747 family)
VPRWSGTIIEPRVRRILERYDLQPSDFSDPHALEGKFARADVPESIRSLITDLRTAAEAVKSREITGDARDLIPDAVPSGLQRDLSFRIDRFERRVAAAVKRKGTASLRDIAVARASLYPLGKPQERGMSFVALIARYGAELIVSMQRAAREHASRIL